MKFALLALLLTPFAFAQQEALTTLLEAGPLPAEGERAYGGAHIGVSIIDAATGEVLFDHHADEAFTPASSLKLLVTAATLYRLGPDYRFETHALAPALEDGTASHLTLYGVGDPTLSNVASDNSLEALASRLYRAGLRQVGELRIDDSAFAWPRWGSGWMWDDPAYPVGALFLEGNSAPYAVMTRPHANPELITDPDAYPLAVGELFRVELVRAGVRVTGNTVRSGADEGDEVLAGVQSASLADIVRDTNKFSHNHHAEQLYARLGMGENGEASTPTRSAEALSAFLTEAGLDSDDMRLRDASGLSRYNLITPAQFTTLLHHTYNAPITVGEAEAAPDTLFDAGLNLFAASLPVAGTSGDEGGTLASRLVGSGLEVRAKTGTMTGVSSLTGYLHSRSGRVLAFSLLMDNYVGLTSDLRRLQDALLEAMAELE